MQAPSSQASTPPKGVTGSGSTFQRPYTGSDEEDYYDDGLSTSDSENEPYYAGGLDEVHSILNLFLRRQRNRRKPLHMHLSMRL